MPSIRMKAAVNGEVTEVQALVQHPMDSGFVKDTTGKLIPAHHIETLVFQHNGNTVFTALWGPAVSKDPYLKFAFRGAAKGDQITATWIDNVGKSDTGTAKIA
jgi:sulfur-oxidizing protein SoxZ